MGQSKRTGTKTAVALPKNSEASIELHIDQEGGSCAYEGSAIIIVSKTTKVFNDAVATLNLSGKLEPGTSSDYKQCEMRSKPMEIKNNSRC